MKKLIKFQYLLLSLEDFNNLDINQYLNIFHGIQSVKKCIPFLLLKMHCCEAYNNTVWYEILHTNITLNNVIFFLLKLCIHFPSTSYHLLLTCSLFVLHVKIKSLQLILSIVFHSPFSFSHEKKASSYCYIHNLT